jgi:hypothetical protein
VENTGNVAARDVAMGLDALLPVQTQLDASPDLDIDLKRSHSIPPMDQMVAYIMGTRAFTVEIPLVPAKASISFTLETTLDTNVAACKQLMKIGEIRREIITDFSKKVLEMKVVTPVQLPDVEVLVSAFAKKDCLFHPDKVRSEQRRQDVTFITPTEIRSFEMFREAVNDARSVYAEIVNSKDECMTPVFTVEQSDGTDTVFGLYPPRSGHLR